MKPFKHFLLNNVTTRAMKIMDRADKNWAHFQNIKYFKKMALIKVGSSQKKIEISLILSTSFNIRILNFGRSEGFR